VATVLVRFWAGARHAAGHVEESLEVSDVAALRELLGARPELSRVVAAASFLVDEVQASDATVLHDGSVVDVLPPFAGGAIAAGGLGAVQRDVGALHQHVE
jgi:molybdopterin converting factor small subunit